MIRFPMVFANRKHISADPAVRFVAAIGGVMQAELVAI
jgi:hypothetical protein